MFELSLNNIKLKLELNFYLQDTIESYLVPPERPPLPKTLYPARPGLPVEEIETESVFDLPQPTANEPILVSGVHNKS